MTDRPEPLTVRIPEACRMMGIGRSKLYELIQEGEIAIVKVGAMTLVPVAGLKAFLARQPTTMLQPGQRSRRATSQWGLEHPAPASIPEY